MLTIPRPKQTFDFKLEGGDEVYSLPLMKNLPVEYVAEIAALAGDEHAALNLIVRVLDEFAPGVTKRIGSDGLTVLFEAWASDASER